MNLHNISEDRLRELHLQTVEEFNQSAFAKEIRLALYPGRYQRQEAKAILSKLPPGGHYLDIGTGAGVIPVMLHRLGCQVTAVDSPDYGGRGALKRLNDMGIQGYFAQVGEQPLPIQDGSMDLAFAGDVIEHLPHSPKPFLRDLHRVLKKGGWLILTTPNAVRLTARFKVLMGRTNWAPINDFFDETLNIGHHKEYTMAELKSVVERTAYAEVQGSFLDDRLTQPFANGVRGERATQIKSVLEVKEPLSTKIPRHLARWLTYLNPNFKSTLLVMGRK